MFSYFNQCLKKYKKIEKIFKKPIDKLRLLLYNSQAQFRWGLSTWSLKIEQHEFRALKSAEISLNYTLKITQK